MGVHPEPLELGLRTLLHHVRCSAEAIAVAARPVLCWLKERLRSEHPELLHELPQQLPALVLSCVRRVRPDPVVGAQDALGHAAGQSSVEVAEQDDLIEGQRAVGESQMEGKLCAQTLPLRCSS